MDFLRFCFRPLSACSSFGLCFSHADSLLTATDAVSASHWILPQSSSPCWSQFDTFFTFFEDIHISFLLYLVKYGIVSVVNSWWACSGVCVQCLNAIVCRKRIHYPSFRQVSRSIPLLACYFLYGPKGLFFIDSPVCLQ